MKEFKHISVTETYSKLQQGEVVIVDIRDEQSYASGHIADSFHLTNGSLNQFMQQTDFETPVVVVLCFISRPVFRFSACWGQWGRQRWLRPVSNR